MSSFSSSDGLSLHFEDCGNHAGQPLICLAGLTRAGSDFRYFLPHAPDLRLILLDARGRGQSDYDPDFSNYNIAREAQDVLELMDHLDLEKAAILGTSRGGMVAMVLAATAKHRLQAVILNDVGPEIPASGVARIMEYIGRRPAAKIHAEAAETLARLMAPAFPDVEISRWQEEVETFYTASPAGLQLRYDAHIRDALLAQANAGPTPDLWPLLRSLEGLPAGIIRGTNSDILSQETYHKMQECLPEMEAVEVPNRGHVPFLDEPESLSLIETVLEQI